MSSRLNRLWFVTIFVAWSFDFLFWRKYPGASIALFIILLVTGVLTLAWSEGKKPSRNSLWLLAPVVFFALATFVRQEPFSRFLSFLLATGLLALFALTMRGGRWPAYSLSDYGAGLFRLGIDAIALPVQAYLQKTAAETSPPEERRFSRRALIPVVRGLALALPVVLVFAALLSSADPVFENRLADFIKLFNLENLGEYIFRTIYILVLAYVLAGAYLHALDRSQSEHLIGLEKPWLPAFLGFTEATIIMGSVCLLFTAFVAIQFQYFFGGEANISYAGFTYSEYARRGFGELVTVAVFSLLLFLGLSTVTRRTLPRQRGVFSSLGVVLVLLVGVILTSAFQRLLLYESAFGFTRLRTYPHVFMVWLGMLLVAFVGLEIRQRTRYFALAVLVASLGFGLSINLINVDAFVVQQNVKRARGGAALDTNYLLTLSADATPALLKHFTSPRLSQNLRDELGLVLACQSARLKARNENLPWPSRHLADMQALRLLDLNQEALQAYPAYQENGLWYVDTNGIQHPCQVDFWD